MAEPYLERISQILDRLNVGLADGVRLESKHFFSGAAMYANGRIFATLSPAGFAVKLPAEQRQRLLDEGKGMEFRFFDQGPIKKEYVGLSEAVIADERELDEFLLLGVSYAAGEVGTSAA